MDWPCHAGNAYHRIKQTPMASLVHWCVCSAGVPHSSTQWSIQTDQCSWSSAGLSQGTNERNGLSRCKWRYRVTFMPILFCAPFPSGNRGTVSKLFLVYFLFASVLFPLLACLATSVNCHFTRASTATPQPDVAPSTLRFMYELHHWSAWPNNHYWVNKTCTFLLESFWWEKYPRKWRWQSFHF